MDGYHKTMVIGKDGRIRISYDRLTKSNLKLFKHLRNTKR